MKASCTDADFINLFPSIGPTKLAQQLGVDVRKVYERRRAIEARYSIQLTPPGQTNNPYPDHIPIDLPNGETLICSDIHLWPGDESQMLRAFKKLCDDVRPKAVILNGDVLDFPAIGRHPPLNWEELPNPQHEIECAQDHLADIANRVKRARKIWNLGNHDSRFEMRLASIAPQFAKVAGIHLHDHFPLWEKSWGTWINNNTVVKHRFKGGIHATYNNTLHAGKTMVTGHLHSAQVRPFTDYNGTRFGVDTGCLANIYSKQFDYLEGNPRNWVSAFGLLTYKDSKLLWPELITSFSETHVQFRGKLIRA